MRYHIGDRVIVRPDLKIDTHYAMFDDSTCINFATPNMVHLAGQEVVIEDYCGVQYRVTGLYEAWTDEMFAGLANSVKLNIDSRKLCEYI